MRVLFVASECYPLAKTGGLADVVGALPLALTAAGCEVRVLLPGYRGVLAAIGEGAVEVGKINALGSAGRLLAASAAGGLQVLVLDMPAHFDRPGSPYVDAAGRDWHDNHLRFAALAHAGAQLATGALAGWQPDIVHAHDWQAGLLPAYLALGPAHARSQTHKRTPRPPCVFTIHNLAYQGVFGANVFAQLGLPDSAFNIDGLEFHGQVSMLKAGLQYADAITTVSPAYAREIQTPAFGEGLDGVLQHRAAVLSGILNGIDEQTWNPASDTHISSNYDRDSLDSKAPNKLALQTEFGLAPEASAPLFCVVSRLTGQKGLDLLLAAVPALVEHGGQLALLGSGDKGLEEAFLDLQRLHPDRVGVRIGYDEALSHRLQAGADAIVIPSRFEPCGLTQLYGLRYGTVPVVARTGGLEDTVIDANYAALKVNVGTGVQFSPITADGLRGALTRACELYAAPQAWRALQRRAMAQPVDWSGPAAEYLQLYQCLPRGTG